VTLQFLTLRFLECGAQGRRFPLFFSAPFPFPFRRRSLEAEGSGRNYAGMNFVVTEFGWPGVIVAGGQ
jgi:hypothetical protein